MISYNIHIDRECVNECFSSTDSPGLSLTWIVVVM